MARALYLPFGKSCPEEPLATRLDRIWQEDRSLANLLRIAICTDAHRGPRLRAVADAPELALAAARLAGRPLDGRVVRVRAGIRAFPEHLHDWHSDVARDDGTRCGGVRITAWIPLKDTGPGEGGLELVPGRRNAPLPHREDRAFSIAEDSLAGMPRIRPDCPAGSVLFLDRFTPHRSLPVEGSARFALVIWMKGAPTA
ncbi:phytanoyl-CoA dioxygenase family protein [Tsuneonella sp. CC-YZS046]|uniref:phytanoyl-CoA dioxygenase family protein n=1 Tax=Tsuneonella sp. CC-YZS046 TaxID=3042152 RepID=UPI002D76BC44|nr:phytanoyl-CoA dioxygenase family protein [Tsuneonella sp. CC-YZS046]WRO66268.1 phytanoyl-CoA dioxygenase family protein [Tsuneonella sp. CC-YZS046]